MKRGPSSPPTHTPPSKRLKREENNPSSFMQRGVNALVDFLYPPNNTLKSKPEPKPEIDSVSTQSISAQADIGPIYTLPDDLFTHLMRHLSYFELINMHTVSQHFNRIANFCWEKIYFPLFSWVQTIPSLHEQKIALLNHFKRIKALFHYNETLNTMGNNLNVLIALPPSCIQKSVHGDDEVTLFAKNNSSEDKIEILSEHLYPGYSRMGMGESFFALKGEILPHPETKSAPFSGGCYFPNPDSTEYLQRLIYSEPCGAVVDNQETEPKTTPEGLPVIQLCDKEGKTLDFSKLR